MPHSLIMPKQTGQLDVFYASLQLFYNSNKAKEEWVTNEKFKLEIQKLLPYLSKGAQDGAYLVKQSELTRYFGLAFYDYPKRRTKITDRGIIFYNAYLQNNQNLQLDIIMESILNDSFGRNTSAVESSNSDVDAPKLFIKSILDLKSITRKDLAYLLYVTHDKQVSYYDALCEYKSLQQNREINIPPALSNKYSDVKFTILLTKIGICKTAKNNSYILSDYVVKNYESKIKNLSIYNKQPEIIFTLKEEIDIANTENLEDDVIREATKTQIVTSFAYDIESEKFKQQNNRMPISYNTKNGVKYKINPRLSKTALQLANFKCQIDENGHITFISKLGTQYMEAHHLIPMHAQKDFSQNLDRIENIICICPNCHAGIHLGSTAVRLEYLKVLFDAKIKDLNYVGINVSLSDLFTKYYK